MTSQTITQAVGIATAEWEESSPLKWTMSEPPRKRGLTQSDITCDLSGLVPFYALEFLLSLKDVLVQRRHRVKLGTINNECYKLHSVLKRVSQKGFEPGVLLGRIDSSFLVALHSIATEIPLSYLQHLRSLFELQRNNDQLFEPGLSAGDFPDANSKRGSLGDRINSILAKAIRRSTLVHVLDVVETAFEEQRLDLGRYSLCRLALNIFCRPESYRQLTLADLRIDRDATGVTTYFLDVMPAKSRSFDPWKITYRLHDDVGRLLAMQRQAVVKAHGSRAPQGVDGPNYGKLALFPAQRLRPGTSEWLHPYANANAGMYQSGRFNLAYLKPIRALTATAISFNALRHTIGTQLAQMGCSAHTIQAILKHADSSTAKAYVDIAFHGLIDELSDALQPGFDEHFPVVHSFISATQTIPTERLIESEDLSSLRHETTGMCGRQVACNYAPLACYTCPRFVPCYDADHSINLAVIDQEISHSEGRGLAMQHDVKRWKTIRNHLRLVISACDVKKLAVESQNASGAAAS